MRKLLFTTALTSLLLAVVITNITSAQVGAQGKPSADLQMIDAGTFASNSYLCPLKGTSVTTLKFECQRCCDLGEAAYQACRRQRGNTICDCIETARNICIGEGCGPCLCCDSWQTRGEQFQCWPRK